MPNKLLILLCLALQCVKAQTNYSSVSYANSKNIGSNNTINVAPCVNEGFEATPTGTYTIGNAVSGWSVTSRTSNGCTNGAWSPGSSEFAIVSTPLASFPGLGLVGNSPLGGTRVAQLNNFVPNTLTTRLSTTFSVTASNSIFQYAFAGYFQKGFGACCDKPGFFVQVFDCFNNPVSCLNHSVFSNPNSCSSPGFSFTAGNQTGDWTNWQVRTIDLTPYIGSCVTIHAMCKDETFGGYYACVLFDANCAAPTSGGVSYCSGSSVAHIAAPQGYTTYNWQAPPGSPTLSAAQSSLAAITVSSPVAGAVYSVGLGTPSGCMLLATYTIAPTTIGLLNTQIKPSCPLGSNGSATVFPTGSSAGYTYSWLNATNSVISTSSVISSVPAGDYTVTVSAQSNSLCGAVVSAVSVGTAQPDPTGTLVPYCTTAYLYAPVGSNYQWYNSNTAISGTAGVLPTLTIASPSNNAIFRLGYSNLGCRDSVIFTLVASTPGTLLASGNSYSCPGTPSGSATVVYTPVPNGPFSFPVSYTLQSLQGFNPVYNYTLSTSANTFSAALLYAGQTYSVRAFDGYCLSNYTFNLMPLAPAFNFSVNVPSPAICSGRTYSANVNFNIGILPGQFSYSWTPTTFLNPGSATLQSAVISPSAASGSTSSVIYTVVITPTAAYCPVTNTFQLITSNPVTPGVSAIPLLCRNAPAFSLQVAPGGGFFVNNSPNGIITPSLYTPGVYSGTYAVSLNSCVATSNFSFAILPLPTVAIWGNNAVCPGSTLALYTGGADTYLWSNLQTGSVAIVSPTVATTYSVIGTNTLGNCQSSKSILVTMLPQPSIQALGKFWVCAGETTTLDASGAASYTWMPGNLANPLAISPLTTTVLTLFGTGLPNGCVGSTQVTLVVNQCLNISENQNRSGIRIYPNPGSGKFNFECNEDMTVTVYSSIGQLLQEYRCVVGANALDLSTLSDGIYPVVCKSKSQHLVIKLIKQH